jgi:hypothetical protein
MFTRSEASRIKHEFWTTFGRYMAPVLSSEGEKINWINYHTGVKDIYFRMEASSKSASIAISLEHKNPDIQRHYFARLLELQDLLHITLIEKWDWQLHIDIDGRVLTRISKTLPNVSVMNKEHWADLISFFKPRIIALDHFSASAKYHLEADSYH